MNAKNLRRTVALAAIYAMWFAISPAMAQATPARRTTENTPVTLPEVQGARPSENMKRKTAHRSASDRERLALVEALIGESRGEVAALEQASAELQPLLERRNTSVDALMLAGRIATLLEQPAIAALHYRAVLASNPNNADAQLGLGNALTALQDVAGADAAFARYRELIGLTRR